MHTRLTFNIPKINICRVQGYDVVATILQSQHSPCYYSDIVLKRFINWYQDSFLYIWVSGFFEIVVNNQGITEYRVDAVKCGKVFKVTRHRVVDFMSSCCVIY